jgi:hypothetical protein
MQQICDCRYSENNLTSPTSVNSAVYKLIYFAHIRMYYVVYLIRPEKPFHSKSATFPVTLQMSVSVLQEGEPLDQLDYMGHSLWLHPSCNTFKYFHAAAYD